MIDELRVLMEGEQTRIRPIVRSDMELRQKWFADPEVNRTLLLPETYDLEAMCAWFERARQDPCRSDWLIETLAGDAIGFMGVKGINTNNKSGMLYIVIGRKEYWGRGFGFDAECIGLRYAFEELGLHKVRVSVLEYNMASLAITHKIGFRREGVLRDECFKDGRFHDVHIFGILRDEFCRNAQLPGAARPTSGTRDGTV